jgi:O-acetyl-ADP-ribose deacetylase (regulator of RNase III)
MPIEYVIGDATEPRGEGLKIIVHVCNNQGYWGKGFVLALSKRFGKLPYLEYKKMDKTLGKVSYVKVNQNEGGATWVANIIGQEGIRVKNGIPPVRYEAIASGFMNVLETFLGNKYTIHMPRIGCGLAGGEWSKVEALINAVLSEKDVTVYDLPM